MQVRNIRTDFQGKNPIKKTYGCDISIVKLKTCPSIPQLMFQKIANKHNGETEG
jgi:hypothetical protein